jgi:hypothetical protein
MSSSIFDTAFNRFQNTGNACNSCNTTTNTSNQTTTIDPSLLVAIVEAVNSRPKPKITPCSNLTQEITEALKAANESTADNENVPRTCLDGEAKDCKKEWIADTKIARDKAAEEIKKLETKLFMSKHELIPVTYQLQHCVTALNAMNSACNSAACKNVCTTTNTPSCETMCKEAVCGQSSSKSSCSCEKQSQSSCGCGCKGKKKRKKRVVKKVIKKRKPKRRTTKNSSSSCMNQYPMHYPRYSY